MIQVRLRAKSGRGGSRSVTDIVRPKVYTIAPERPFLTTLADGLLAMIAGDPTRLPRVTILLPTRRAVHALRDAFLRAAPGGREAGTPLLLPRMRAIGDLDSDELTLADGTADGGTLAVPPAIPELRRRLLLTQLVMRWGQLRGQTPVTAPVRRYSREIARGCGYDVRVIGQLAGTGRSGLQR
jgi:ATP-dependent helicase/nuclease subunit B